MIGVDESNRVMAAFRSAASKALGVEDRVEICKLAATELGWDRVTAKRRAILDQLFRIALHRTLWLTGSEGARRPYPFGDPRPLARYDLNLLVRLAGEALAEVPGPVPDAEAVGIVGRFLGFQG